jgi:hypothetical protein
VDEVLEESRSHSKSKGDMTVIIQNYPDELDYVNAKLHPLASKLGSFLDQFLRSCLAADDENCGLVRPVLLEIMKKYPAEEARLEIERRDSGR